MKLHWLDSSVHLLISVYLTTLLRPSIVLSLSLQCFGCCPVAMQRQQQWALSVWAHHCPRNTYLIVACFKRGNTMSCLPAELFHGLILLLSLSKRLLRFIGNCLHFLDWWLSLSMCLAGLRQCLPWGLISHWMLLSVCSCSSEKTFVCLTAIHADLYPALRVLGLIIIRVLLPRE